MKVNFDNGDYTYLVLSLGRCMSSNLPIIHVTFMYALIRKVHKINGYCQIWYLLTHCISRIKPLYMTPSGPEQAFRTYKG